MGGEGQNDSVNLHWHVAILLKGDAYRSLGRFELGHDNMYNTPSVCMGKCIDDDGA